MDRSIIKIDNLKHRYGRGAMVLKGLSLSVQRGEVIGLIGLSGAGKSTLLRCVNGLITPTSGSVNVLGKDIPMLPERQRRLIRRQIGMIFQEFNLVDRLSVITNVLVGRLGYSATIPSCLHIFPASSIEFAKECIAQVGLEDYEDVLVKNLSGGQKQRVAIARTMAQEAKIILGDEATANLDVKTTESVMELLKNIADKNGTTLLLSMHNLEVARRYCPRIIGLKDGILTFDGPAASLSDHAVSEILV